MKLRLLSTFFALFAVAACATATKTQIGDGTVPPDGTMPPDDGTKPPAEESDDPAQQPPHSLGTILLGESHASGASKSTPIVSAAFFPDALLTRACKTKIEAGCEIAKAPKCNKVSTTTTGCNSNEVCTMDNTTCNAVCKPYATCETACAADEVCKPGTGTSSIGTCVKSESFDAGPLAFSGTTTSISMFPPYKWDATGQGGAPFLGGAELRIQAQGATEAGFEKFDEKFTATTFLQTTPSLAKIPREKVFGTGSVPIAWAPANDTILVTVSGAGGSATCKVKDSLGKFDIPRSVVEAAQGDSTTSSSSSVSISVARQRIETKKDKHAKGQLSLATVKPDGWLQLVTLSTESASFQGCATGQAICPGSSSAEACTDLQYDTQNCGSCGNQCGSGQSCYSGKCSGGGTTSCSTCRTSATSGSCSTYYNTCTADINCDNLAYCARSCTTSSCLTSCENSYPSGYSKWSPLKSCLSSACYSSCGF